MSTNLLRGLVETIVDLHGQAERAKYVAIVGTTLLVYDWALNLDLEVAYIWKRSWSIGRVVYHFNRVWPLILIGAVLPKDLFGRPSPPLATCERLSLFFVYGQVVGLSAIWSVFLMRVWALYNQRRILWGLLAAYVCTVGYAFAFVTILAKKNIYLENPLPSVFSGCVMIFPEGIWKIYILPIAWEWTVFALTIWKIWRLKESYGSTPLIQRLAENGIAYFVVLLLLFLFLTIGGSIEQIKIASNGSGFVAAISSVVCSRVIISLHEFKDVQQPQQPTAPFSSAGKLAVAIPLSQMSRSMEEP